MQRSGFSLSDSTPRSPSQPIPSPDRRDDKKAAAAEGLPLRATSPLAARLASPDAAAQAVASARATPPPRRPAAGPTAAPTGSRIRQREVEQDAVDDDPRAAGGKRACKGKESAPLDGTDLGDVITDHLAGTNRYTGKCVNTRRRDGKTISMDPLGAKIYAWIKPGRGRPSNARQHEAGQQLAALLKTRDRSTCITVIRAYAQAVCGVQPLNDNDIGIAMALLNALGDHLTIGRTEMASIFANVFGMSLYFRDQRFLDRHACAEYWIGFIEHYKQLEGDAALLPAFTAAQQHGEISTALMKGFVAGFGGADQINTWGPGCVKMMVDSAEDGNSLWQAKGNFESLCRAVKTDWSGPLPPPVRDCLEAIWLAPGSDAEIARRTAIMSRGVCDLPFYAANTDLAISTVHALFRRPSDLTARQMALVLRYETRGGNFEWPPVLMALAELVQQRTRGSAALFEALGTTPPPSLPRLLFNRDDNSPHWREPPIYPSALERIGELFAIAKPGDADSRGFMAFLGDWCARCELAAAAAPAPGEANTLIKALLQRPQLTPTDPALLSALFTGYASHLLRSPDVRHAYPALQLGVLGMTGSGPLQLTDEQAKAIAQALGALAYTEQSAHNVGRLLADFMEIARPDRRNLIAKQFAESFARNPMLNSALARGLVEALTQDAELSPRRREAIGPLRTALNAALGEQAYTRAEQESIAWDRPARTDRTSDSKSSGSVMPPSLSGPSLLTRLTDLDRLDDSPAALPDITPRQRGVAALFMQVLRTKRDLATTSSSSSSSSSSAISGPEPERQSLTEAVTTVSDALATSITTMAPEAPLSREALLEAATNFQRRALPGHTAADWVHDAMAFGWRIGLQHLPRETQLKILDTRVARLKELFKVEPWGEQVETDPVLQGWINVIAGSPGMQHDVQAILQPFLVAFARYPLFVDGVPRTFYSGVRHFAFRAAQQLAPDLASHVGSILRAISPGDLAQENLTELAQDLQVLDDSDDVRAWLEFGFTQEANDTAQVALRALLAAMESRPEHADYFVDRSIVLTACSQVPDPRGRARELVINCVRNPGGLQSEARVLIQAIKNFTAYEMHHALRLFISNQPRQLDDARTASLFAALLTDPLSDAGDRPDALTVRQFCKLLVSMTSIPEFKLGIPQAVPGERSDNRHLLDQMLSPRGTPPERLLSAHAVGKQDMLAVLTWHVPIVQDPMQLAIATLTTNSTVPGTLRLAAAGAVLSVPRGLGPNNPGRPFAHLRALRISFLEALRVRDDAEFSAPGLKPHAQGSYGSAERTVSEIEEISRRHEHILPLVGAYLQYVRQLPQYAFLYAPVAPSSASSSSSSAQDAPPALTHSQHQDLLALLQFLDEEIVVMTRPEVHPVDRDHLLLALGELRAPVMSALKNSPWLQTPGAGKSAKEPEARPLDR